MFFHSSMTIAMASKRLYIGNLFPDVQDADLTKLFGKFGTVDKVEIKKKTDVDGKVMTTFAFVTLQISDDDISKCIQQNNNLKWKKHMIKVQQAQESFLSRLQRERDQASKLENVAEQKTLKYDPPISTLQTNNANKRKTFNESDEELDEIASKPPPVKQAKKSLNSTISFDDEGSDGTQGNRLEFRKQSRVYHSSSEDEDDYEKPGKVKKSNSNVLAKLESFNSGFWKDDDDEEDENRGLKKSKEVTLEGPFGKKKPVEEKVVEVKTEQTEPMSIFGQSSGTFSLLKTFGNQDKEEIADDKEEEVKEEKSSVKTMDNFALKLKEKAINESSSGPKELFFFVDNDERFLECQRFLKSKESLDEIRTNYEQKRPVLASIMKRKMKNKARKQEKMSFSATKKKRKFNANFKKKKFNK